MAVKFKFYGTQKDVLSGNYQNLQSMQPDVQVIEYTAFTVRSAAVQPVVVEMKEKDIVELQLSNDVTWHYRADEFESFLQKQPGSRGGAGDVLEVPAFLVSQQPGTRGLGDIAIPKSLKVFTGWAAKKTAVKLAEKLESTLLLGLHRCNENFGLQKFEAASATVGKPYLLFIHGTNSNIKGAFGDLLSNEAYKKLYNYYQGRIIAFEHKTLSQSPLANVTELLQSLPTNISLDVISHSRGGIVADLLARTSNGAMLFNNEELKVIGQNEELKVLKAEIDMANAAAKNKNIVVNKLVRVACPAAGTVLIGKRMDTYVNVICNLVKLIPGADACIPLNLFLDFAKAVVQERTDVEALPGLEAQRPESPFIKLLNNPIREITSELFVISGDVESSGIWNSLKVVATNLYFGEAHDLVVNSNSMFKGTYRSTNVYEHFEQKSNVNHFNYFKNKSSQNALLAALTNPESIHEFYEEIGITSEIRIIHKRGDTGKKPLVYILPGVMGSNLEVANDRVWVNFIRMGVGEISRLKIESKNIVPESLHHKSYGNLINYLSSDFDVVPFPYDWRMPLNEAGDLLAKDIEKELNSKTRTCKEFYFIVHSMGGLVMRSMIQSNDKLWKKIAEIKKPRVIMLGVPNEGSYGTIRILLGKDSIIKKLALLDFFHPKKFLINIFKEYPALVQLLPCNHNGIFDVASWTDLESANDEFTGVPAQKTLKQGLDFFDTIKNTNYDNDIFRYVAGQDDSTPDNYRIIKDEGDGKRNKIIFTATGQGDGRVLWSTIPSSLLPQNVYFVPADHGSIPDYEPAFEGFKELLLKGSTTFISNTKPSSRGEGTIQVMPDSDFVSVPTAGELDDAIMSNKEKPRKKTTRQNISISITNGDLVHSSYPLVVGHFAGDGIVKAEWYLNKALNYKLSEYHLAGNYPGEIGTHLVILKDEIVGNDQIKCNGGIVVGLGDFGSLTENRLVLSLTQAFLTLAIKHNESCKNDKEDLKKEFGVSSLLIGSDFAGLRIQTSLKAILTAVLQANEKLEAMNGIQYQKINHVEIIEIYQHKTIQVARAINHFMEEDRFSSFKFSPPVIRIGSGSLKVIADETQQDDWHRIEVSIVKEADAKNDEAANPDEKKKIRAVRFVSITDKAHADEELLPTNRLIVDSLIEKVSKHSRWDKSFSQTLYELLIPNQFKGYGSSLRNLVLIVDKETARYPWELLHDANGISDKPMVINTGIIRQLSTATYRKHVELNTSNRALVIGNPLTNGVYPDLPAAKKEAENVLNIFKLNTLETTDCIEKDDTDIVQKLLTQSYKIIHIASHGIVGKTPDEPTGVVIGDEIVFSAADFEQIRIVPEFVFINCCSSNQYDLAVADQMRRKYQLAASVGTQLIEMGVKAAIVTGWEIDDNAANLFADEFYRSMFNGKNFGESVRCAREKTYSNFGQTNTWGAYQCYGDPFYSFISRSGGSKRQKRTYVDKVEVIYDIDNLISQVTSASKRKDAKEYEPDIKSIEDALQAGWKDDPKITERFATLYKTLNQFEKAIEYYQKLFILEDSRYTVKSIEQYWNISVRHALKQMDASPKSKASTIKKMREAISNVEKLNGTTFERYSLVAGFYRRLFDVGNNYQSLVQAARYYRLAYEYSQKTTGQIHYYPYFNWLHFAILLANNKNRQAWLKLPKNINDLSEKALSYAIQLDNAEPDFWDKTALSSRYLAELLMSHDAREIGKFAKLIESNFKDAWRIEGNASMKDSFSDYIRFIIQLLTKLPTTNKTTRDAKVKALNALAANIK